MGGVVVVEEEDFLTDDPLCSPDDDARSSLTDPTAAVAVVSVTVVPSTPTSVSLWFRRTNMGVQGGSEGCGGRVGDSPPSAAEKKSLSASNGLPSSRAVGEVAGG